MIISVQYRFRNILHVRISTMKNTEQFTMRGKTTQFTTIDDFQGIVEELESRGLFHDATIEHIGHDAECTSISFHHYEDPEYKMYTLVFEGSVDLQMNYDARLLVIYEIAMTAGDCIEAVFDGTGIIVKAEKVKLTIRELV